MQAQKKQNLGHAVLHKGVFHIVFQYKEMLPIFKAVFLFFMMHYFSLQMLCESVFS